MRFWLFTALVFGLALSSSVAFADEVQETWINPAYQDVPPDKAPQPSKVVRDGETFYVNSYSGFKSTVLDKVRNRMVQFNINVTGFPFSEVVKFSASVQYGNRIRRPLCKL
ncbi:MAG: hypothetical protein HC887_12135 [Desulfobacteraceae bacterium]|nr:hypothetical protein [Desulfobacteraceae bacterium]